MDIVELAVGDDAAARACCQVTQASLAVDDPLGAPMSERRLRVEFEHPTEPARTWYLPGETRGTATGVCHLRLPDRENRHRASIWLDVHPDHRRRGIGSALLRHAARHAADGGRSVIGGEAWAGSPGAAFALGAGATPGIADARRILLLEKLPAGQTASLRESAARAAAGYTLLSWTGRTPDEYIDSFAAVFNAMNDGPRNPGREDRIWDAQRVRRNIDRHTELTGSRAYCVVARHDGTGEIAGVTRVAVDPEFPEWGNQLITAVSRQHRGHRLGLLLKAAMLEWLASAEPQLRRIETWNAAANEHMIAINAALGYELFEPLSQSFELQVADVLGAGGVC